MSQQATGGSFAWICPCCSRQVPNRVRLCRCGYEHGCGVQPSAPLPVPEARAARTRVPWTLVWDGVSVVFLAVLAVQWSSPDTAPPASSSSALSDPGLSETPAGAPQLEFVPARVPATRPPVAPIPVPLAPSESSTRPAFSEAPPALEDVIDAALPAIVSIESSAGRGTGFFVAPGVVVTNEHVISGNWSVTLKGAAGAMRSRVTKVAPELDLAILQVDHPGAPQAILPLGSATTARVGQEVIAIGFALGLLENTVTRGIISGIRTAGPATYVQTDAAINVGNSGGLLIDRHGRVIGITTLKFGDSVESLGFTVAVHHVKPLLNNSGAESPRPAASPATNVELSSLLDRSVLSTADQRRTDGQAALEEASAALRSTQVAQTTSGTATRRRASVASVLLGATTANGSACTRTACPPAVGFPDARRDGTT